MEKIAETALWVAILAITMSASAITWSVSRVKTVEQKVAHLEGTIDLLEVRITNQTAWLNAHGIEVE